MLDLGVNGWSAMQQANGVKLSKPLVPLPVCVRI